MGVLGLTPFLQKICPEVIKYLPNRLHSLAGKTIVIDGTLITQRFHYSQAPHRYRHVLGWYRLVKELNDAGVSAICVFDGKERNIAKAREVERRKEAQRTNAVRGALEHGRSKRLRKLSNILRRFRYLGGTAQQRATDLLQRLRTEVQTNVTEARSREPSPSQQLEDTKACLLQTIPYHVLLPHQGDTFSSNFVAEETLEPALENDFISSSTNDVLPELHEVNSQGELGRHEHSLLLNHLSPIPKEMVEDFHRLRREHLPTDTLSHILSVQTGQSYLETTGWLSSTSGPELLPLDPDNTPLMDEHIAAALASLYLDYRRSLSMFTQMTKQLTSSLSPSSPTTDTQAEIVMTKAQYQLTLEEGELWDHFLSTVPKVNQEATTTLSETTLANLAQTSEVMSESFQRRMNPPTFQMYNECKEILRAMGLPCVDSSGAFEAEALASSLVLNGLADYVASEDTDVLVYGAPLIRNLTNRNVPLTVVAGGEIHTVLQLDRASFVDFALLLGTDFSQRIKNVGPTRALKLIKEHGSIERVIELEPKYPPRSPHNTYLAQVRIARLAFRTLPPVPEKKILEPGIADESEVTTVLHRYGLGRVVMDSGYWDYNAALVGNYFRDNPSASL